MFVNIEYFSSITVLPFALCWLKWFYHGMQLFMGTEIYISLISRIYLTMFSFLIIMIKLYNIVLTILYLWSPQSSSYIILSSQYYISCHYNGQSYIILFLQYYISWYHILCHRLLHTHRSRYLSSKAIARARKSCLLRNILHFGLAKPYRVHFWRVKVFRSPVFEWSKFLRVQFLNGQKFLPIHN